MRLKGTQIFLTRSDVESLIVMGLRSDEKECYPLNKRQLVIDIGTQKICCRHTRGWAVVTVLNRDEEQNQPRESNANG